MDEKTCPSCQLTKPLQEFGWRDKGHTKLQSFCRNCTNEAWRRSYYDPANHQQRIDGALRRRKRRLARQNQLIRKLKSSPCSDCGGIFPPFVMDFDHVGPKTANISALMSSNSFERIESELANCELVCANCHRIRTQTRLLAKQM